MKINKYSISIVELLFVPIISILMARKESLWWLLGIPLWALIIYIDIKLANYEKET